MRARIYEGSIQGYLSRLATAAVRSPGKIVEEFSRVEKTLFKGGNQEDSTSSASKTERGKEAAPPARQQEKPEPDALKSSI